MDVLGEIHRSSEASRLCFSDRLVPQPEGLITFYMHRHLGRTWTETKAVAKTTLINLSSIGESLGDELIQLIKMF